jgi:type IV secretion system protein TrbI
MSQDDTLMLPEESPPPPSAGVRRVNNLPLFIAVGGVAAFVLVIAGVAYKRGEMQRQTTIAEEKAPKNNLNSTDLANSVLSQQGLQKLILPLETPVVATSQEKQKAVRRISRATWLGFGLPL